MIVLWLQVSLLLNNRKILTVALVAALESQEVCSSASHYEHAKCVPGWSVPTDCELVHGSHGLDYNLVRG